jgi:flagellar motor switch protein FliM
VLDKERAAEADKSIHVFDFRQPTTFNRDHVRALQLVHEAFARHLGTVLSTTLGAVSQVSLQSVDQITYDQYVKASGNPTMLAIVSLQPLPGAALLQVPLRVAMVTLDRLLGGPGSGEYPNRPLTEIESLLMRRIVDRALNELERAFEPLLPLETGIVQLESNPQFAQVAAPSDMVVVITLQTRIGGEQGDISICIPFASLQPVLERFAAHSLVPDRTGPSTDTARAAMRGRLSEVPVEVMVHFDEVALTSDDLVQLRVGDVLPLRHRTDQPLTASVGDAVLAAVSPGRKGKRLACRVVNPENRP